MIFFDGVWIFPLESIFFQIHCVEESWDAFFSILHSGKPLFIFSFDFFPQNATFGMLELQNDSFAVGDSFAWNFLLLTEAFGYK